METIESTKNKMVFSAKIEESLANAIRRYVHEIPVLAIDEVEIHQNGSPLYDETLAHRIGLVPLKMAKGYKEDTEVKFSIKKKGPGYVYSGDIKSEAEVVYDKIPLTLLKENQEIDVKGTAKLGKGSYHTKHAPGFMFYRNSAEISLPKKMTDEVRKICPSSQVKEKGEKVVIKDNQAKPLVDLCQAIAEKNKESVEVKFDEELIISVESFGQLDSKEIFKESVEHLKKDLQFFAKQIK